MSPISTAYWGPLIGLGAGMLLWFGSYRLIERCFVGVVFLMSGIFLFTAIWIHPPIGALLSGLAWPRIPSGSTLTVIALIGTTVVPYNLFLHSATVRQKWSGPDQLSAARWDLGIALVIGGLISCAIMVTAAMAFPLGQEVRSAADMAHQLEPVLGNSAVFIFAIGLFAAGMTSAITAPLAAAYAAAGILGWSFDLKSTKMRAVWIAVIGIGVVGAGLDIRPTTAIVLAQYANGLLLPLVAVFLLLVMNRSDALGQFRNKWQHNVLGGLVLLVTLLLALKSLGIFEFILD